MNLIGFKSIAVRFGDVSMGGLDSDINAGSAA